tara:strand:- start:1395 stop:2819 length:1425 start_codon:yes stop_codon:yes gene_type:complete
MANNFFYELKSYSNKPIAIEDSGSHLTLNDCLDVKDRIGKLALSRGLVFCFCKNSIGAFTGYLVFLSSGIVPLLLDASKGDDIFDPLFEAYQPNYLWLPESRSTLVSRGDVIFAFRGYVFVELNQDCVPMDKNLSLLLTTSGSTGSPKLVRLSYSNLQSNAESITEYLEIDSQDRPVTSLPMYYSYGLSVINSHVLKGATILLTDKSIMQKEFWDFVSEQRATSFSGVPYTYEMLKRLHFFRMDLPNLKTLTQAGGKLSPVLVQEFVKNAKASGKRFLVMYGQTEASPRMSYLPFEFAEEKFDTIGIVIPGGRFELVDENGIKILEMGIDGELVYYGANVSLGYAESKEDLVKGDENNGVLHTGDIARRDADGFYEITGRMKRFIKIWGNLVNLDAAEQIAKTIEPGCACMGIDDKLTLFVSPSCKRENLLKKLSEKMGLHPSAFRIQELTDIPKNSSGKVLYAELNKLLQETK